MDVDAAKALMRSYIEGLNQRGDAQLRQTDFVSRIEGAWVFYYNSAEFLETGEFGAQLVGQGPTLILDDGTVFQAGSAETPESAMRRRLAIGP